jgi:hypothetical protein
LAHGEKSSPLEAIFFLNALSPLRPVWIIVPIERSCLEGVLLLIMIDGAFNQGDLLAGGAQPALGAHRLEFVGILFVVVLHCGAVGTMYRKEWEQAEQLKKIKFKI